MRPIALALLVMAFTPASAFDGFALTAGRADVNGNLEPVEETYIGRLTAIQDHSRGPSFEDGWIGERFWEFDVGYWRWDDKGPGGEGDLWEIAATPVFRLQRDGRSSLGLWPFMEAAIGAHLISETVVSSRQLSTNFHFGSHLGVGALFGEHKRYGVALRLQHLSNAGIKTPNPGINLYLVTISYRFR